MSRTTTCRFSTYLHDLITQQHPTMLTHPTCDTCRHYKPAKNSITGEVGMGCLNEEAPTSGMMVAPSYYCPHHTERDRMPEEQATYHTPQTDMPETTHEAECRADFHALARRTIRWAKDKGIHDEGTPGGQADKLLEEATETWAAVRGLSNADAEELQEHADIIVERGAPGGAEGRCEEVRDGFGDIFVTLINTAYAYLSDQGRPGATYAASWLLICWADVLDEIEQRTGEMKDGAFVKSEDL